ncbi:hypothetical protein MCOR24_011719 [Pyricularia oryzae]|nr:hypothetical protein MCOR24_011719 [Pyricularia oryzae]
MDQAMSAPINIESLSLEYPSARAALPNLSGSDSEALENLVQFGMEIWPEKKLDQFRPGQPVTAGILNELLHKVLPPQYAIGVPPHRIHKLKETCAGLVIPYHVNEVDQLTRVESEKNHFVVVIVDMENKKFTSWGMTEEMHRSSRVEYEKALGSLAEDRCKSTAGSLVRENDIDSISSSNVSKVDQGTKIEPPSLKRVASEYPSSSYSPEEEDASVALAGPPPKRKDRQAPPAQVLAEELLATGAERLKRHILTFAQRAHTFPEAFDEHGDWTKQVCDTLNLAKEWDEKSEFSKLVGLILRTHGVELINAAARSMLKLDEEAPDPLVPRAIIDRIFPYVRSERTPASFRSWLTQTRRLLRIKDFLPFMPFGSSDMATFRDYERSTNQDIEQLCNILKNDPRAQQMAQAGWAFGDCILQRRAYLWVSFSPEELSELPEETLLHVVTIRSDPTGRTCGVCKGGKCDLLHFCPALASKQQSSAACDGDDDSQPAPQELMGKYCKDMIPSSAPISLQGIERGADALLPAAIAKWLKSLKWALYGGHSGMHNYEIVQFLVDQGAYVDNE